jgi:hypothetical protein
METGSAQLSMTVLMTRITIDFCNVFGGGAIGHDEIVLLAGASRRLLH